MDRLLFSWLGRTDLRAIEEADTVGTGPVAQAVDTGRFSHLALICDYSATEAQAYLDWLRQRNQTPITVHSVKLDSPTNFDAIYREARRIIAETLKARSSPPELTFHLSPGTPAMAAVWIILAKTRFPAELIESSIRYGVRSVSIPFQMAADFIPDLLRRSDDELTRLTAGLPPAAPAFDAIIHRSAVMQRVVARARRVALRSIPVLIEGDSGTGKELLARAIHQASPRCERPMVTVNCGAIAADLIESELFGHEKGAFTGAISARQGVFEAADTGTLFLDEIGELSKPAQVRFLRALQEGEITRVGATRSIRVDVRIIAATNRSLSQEVSSSRFRARLWLRQAKPGRGGRTPHDLSNRKPLTVTRRVKVPNRKGLAIHRNRVLRGAGATPPAKRTQGAARPCDGAPKENDVEPTLSKWRKATVIAPKVAWREHSTGV
ncbi:sigma-54 factor interaction domain-containing protein [Halochromatium salexigens]|uniref:Sigma-54 factor interaction domain-containing protein n=1 Tax=Halochromatium salexigens TaxID=49447 RepID=A0AAJ0UGZ1_HALSE|nr:sigma-54 factor interaction domain-containing protein [Halochromatium salexigens]MBK5931301.1 hypothetical protein [Halochromatium salexigens]